MRVIQPRQKVVVRLALVLVLIVTGTVVLRQWSAGDSDDRVQDGLRHGSAFRPVSVGGTATPTTWSSDKT
ncbi:hypothetical protein PTSG_13223, partial [Salpingoeca rosetta]